MSELEWSRMFTHLLAFSPDVDWTTLYGLLVQNPQLRRNLSKEATELLALRCLEDVYDPVKVFALQRDPWNRNQFRPNSSDSAINVLHRAIHQSNLKNTGPYQLHDLRKGASDELVKNVHDFVLKKKTQFANAVIQQQVAAPEQQKKEPAEGGKLSTRKKPRREVRRWSSLEEDTLRSGIEKFGKGNWKAILNEYPDVFEKRTDVDLKDKWRNMTR